MSPLATCALLRPQPSGSPLQVPVALDDVWLRERGLSRPHLRDQGFARSLVEHPASFSGASVKSFHGFSDKLMIVGPQISAAACLDDTVQRHRLGHAFELAAAALVNDEQTGDLLLYSRRDQDRARLPQGLCLSKDVTISPASSITTGPESMTMHAARAGLLVSAFIRLSSATARCVASAARTARSKSFS